MGTVISDALPIDIAEQARALFMEREFTHAPYGDPKQFYHQFPEGGLGIPDSDEVYQTDFHTRLSFPEMDRIVSDQIIPLVHRAAGRTSEQSAVYFYKLMPGGHLRLHRDDYAGHTGFVWHLSKNWKWDWGGLMIALDGDGASVTLPVFNSLVILDHSKAIPHCVTQVAPWAREPRMMVTGILR